MSRKTYEVAVTAEVYRTMKVRARSAREATEIAEDRIADTLGPWTLAFPGSPDQHYETRLNGEALGPRPDGIFDDDEEVTA